jgi:hypothetical protein
MIFSSYIFQAIRANRNIFSVSSLLGKEAGVPRVIGPMSQLPSYMNKNRFNKNPAVTRGARGSSSIVECDLAKVGASGQNRLTAP